MNDDKKTLMNERLPAPVKVDRSAVRARVIRHVRRVMLAGAAVLVTGCPPFAVVDPLPNPAKCRTLGVKAALDITLTPVAGANRVRVDVVPQSDSGLTFSPGATVLTGTVFSERVVSTSAELEVAPDASKTASFQLLVACGPDFVNSNIASESLLTITVDFSVSPATFTVTEQLAPDDAGADFDAGADAGDAGADAGASDAGPSDAGISDAGTSDAGPDGG